MTAVLQTSLCSFRPSNGACFDAWASTHTPVNTCSTPRNGRSTCCDALRRAAASDLDRLVELESLTNGSWNPEQIEAELYRERATVLVVDEGEGTVGWAVGWAVPQEIHLMNVAVHPEHQRKGHARALLTALFDQHRGDAESVLLEVRASNESALRLYCSLGFERVGLRRRYYADGEDAVLMTLLLRERRME
ncbi:hypothetical protein D9Q98_006417 [Chlorella vulgaris]|uniref:N-acetyltransferase domain-containing protein n=1 Tax=Chlorella vulgaris TaxID=3077 RepID=A0A9D4TK97_CHLVU|nr:hypothetical protein D9Q98_006417 [Chlorella vulgaris]